jgi:L-threonylcarbamoyladenylate synthase
MSRNHPGAPDLSGTPAGGMSASHDVVAAAAALRRHGLVAFPTETVYGLGAAAADPIAVARVYAAKGRPDDHPLIVHLADASALDDWARDVPPYARALAATIWPGPMTLVLRRSARAGDWVTGGQDTVGLRVPAHPVAARLLEAFGDGVAAPSANRFGRVSPTTAGHVLAELGDRLDPALDMVLDGGPSSVGVESTILDCTGPAPRLLRPGAIGARTVEAVGGVALVDAAGGSVGPGSDTGPLPGVEADEADEAIRAPGTLAAHYAPAARVLLTDERGLVDLARHVADPGRPAAGRVGLIAPADVSTPPGVTRLAAPSSAAGYARILYAALRDADLRGLAVLVAVPPTGSDAVVAAVVDRLGRAAVGSAGPDDEDAT